MPDVLSMKCLPGTEILVVLALGTALVVAAAGALGGRMNSAIWRRTVWQAATLALLLLIACELTGLGSFLADWTSGPAPVAVVDVVASAEASLGRGPVAEPCFRLPEDPRHDAREPERAADALFLLPLDGESAGFESDHQAWPGSAPVLTVASAAEDSVSLLKGGGAEDGGPLAGAAPAPEAAVCSGWASSVFRSPWLVWTWGLGTLAIICRIVRCRLLLWGFAVGWSCARDGKWEARVEGLTHRLGMRRRVRIRSSDRLVTPVALGIFRPAVVLPLTFADDFDCRQQDVILAHELAHLAARDPLWQLLADVAAAVLWWHPLAWWSRRQLPRLVNRQPTKPVWWYPEVPKFWPTVWSRWGIGIPI